MPTDRQYEGQSWRRILLSWAYRPRAGVQRACSGHDRRGRLFFAALLYQVNLSGGLESLEAAHLDRMIAFANAAGSLATTKKGGVASAPALAEIGRCLTDYNTIDFID